MLHINDKEFDVKTYKLAALLLGAALFTGVGATSVFAKCGGEKQEMKCGAGKCGGEKKSMKCGTGKCGGEKKQESKKKSMKCGVGKCG